MINFLFASFIVANTLTTPKMLPPKMASAAAKINNFAKLEGTVSSIGTNSLVVNETTINVSSKTVILRRFGAKSSLTEFSVGDQVQVFGNPNARLIRNLSIQKRRGTFVGTISSLSATGFVLNPNQRPPQSVTVNTKTKYVDRKNTAISFSSLAVGQKVMVNGLWDNKLNTLTEVNLVKDYSIPIKPLEKTE